MNTPLRLLHLEDDDADADIVRNTLEQEGVVCTVTRVDTEADFRSWLAQGGFDLILADYTLPEFDGISALNLAREMLPDVPFIFLSGTLDEEVAIDALKVGATDYVFKTRLSRIAPSVRRALRETEERAALRRSEAAIRASEAFLVEAQRISHTGSFGWKVATGEIIWSDETFRIFQHDRTIAPTVERILQRVHPEDAALVQQTIERASLDGNDFEHEYRLIMPDRSIKHVRVVARGQRDPSGVIEFIGAVMDVTDRTQAEEERRQNEAHLQEAQALGHVGSWVLDVASGAFRASAEFVRIAGVDPDEVRLDEQIFRDRVHPEDRQLVDTRVDQARRRKTDLVHNYRIVHPDGVLRYIHSRSHPVFDESGNLVKYIGTIMDVTDQTRTGTLLAGEKHLLEMIARGDSLAAILDALCRLVEELAVDSLASMLLLDPNSRCLRHGAAPSLPASYTAAIDGLAIGPATGSCGTAAYRAEPVIVPDIDTNPLWDNYRDLAVAHGLRACWSTPILSAEGRVLGTFAIYYREPRRPNAHDHNLVEQVTHLASIAIERDQADRGLREAEAALRQAQAELAYISRVTTMGELTASLAHEVRQPIAAAITDAKACLLWLDREHPDIDEARAATLRVVEDGRRAADIISQIRLLFTKSAPQRERIDVNGLIREMIVLLRGEAVYGATSARTELAADNPWVIGDRVQMQQVMMNLIMNAIEAMKDVDGARELVIASRRTEPDQVQVSVSDTGVGLPPQADRIFNAFFTTKQNGTGLGLSISRSIVESHGGRLWAADNEPRGATFHVALPTGVDTRH